MLFRNEGITKDGTMRFADVAMAVGADDIHDARGMAVGDFDNDGDLDIVVNNNPGDCGKTHVPPVLLRNDVGHKRNWLAVKLTGTKSNRDAVGAEVTIQLAPLGPDNTGTRMLRHVTAGSGYASQHTDRIYFGLGESPRVESLTIRWPSGATQVYHDIPGNQLIRVQEGGQMTPNRLPSASDGRVAQVANAS